MALSRSQQMARIRGRNTTPERKLRSAVWRRGLRHRLQFKTPAGRPDLVYPGPRVAVFVDGCFWHGCPLHYVRPRTREEFWSAKLAENVDRDRRDILELETAGWRVLRFLEHEIDLDFDQVLDEIEGAVRRKIHDTPPILRVRTVSPLRAADEREEWTLVDLRRIDWQRTEIRRRRTTKWRRGRQIA